MKKALSIIEVMFALTLVAVIMAATSPVLLNAMQSNGDSRIRAQAVAAAETWHDRFRANALGFDRFTGGKEFDYNHDYSTDDIFDFAGTPNQQTLNDEWQDYKFEVTTTQISPSPNLREIWRVHVTTFYKRKLGNGSSTSQKEGSFELSTLIAP